MRLKLFTIIFSIIVFYNPLFSADITVTDNDINAGEKVYWTKNNNYILSGFVFVEEGAELHIEAGTVIKGKPGQAEDASALIIARGGKIFAIGTISDPIIFTFEADDPYDPTDQPIDASGQWGGLIVLGKSVTNNPDNLGQIEGIPSDEPRGTYGGGANPDPNDNSGIIRYVSIRHGGTNIGANNEINGLTMGAVGSGTQIDHVEVWYNNDDGFEWFGGTVNTKYLISAFNKDDSFDWDQGYNGKGQFWFSIQKEGIGNMGGELDGGDDIEDAEPYALPDVFNATFIGAGPESGWTNSKALHFRDNSGGKYMNSIFTEMGGKGLEIEDLASGEDSRARLEAGDLVLNNNLWWNFKGGNTLDNIAPDVSATANQQFVRDYLGNAANNNWVEDVMLRGISRTNDMGLDPRPQLNSPALSKTVAEIPEGDDFLVQTNYLGAFGPNNLWIKGWTMMDNAGFVSDGGSSGQIVQVFDTDINAGDDVYWTSNNTYILNGFVFVEEGAKLYIEAGTVIKGKPGQADQASALIIAKGGQIFAEGTPSEPIIFTYEADDPFDPDDQPIDASGQWGGLIILGKSVTNNPNNHGQIEGIPSDEPRGGFGGGANPDPNDNSGIIRYVSIRHGGTNIGANNEINGLTMGAVGSGTQIDHVEVWYNNDDGFEWFGGTVNTKYLISAFNKDDSFDWDQGYNGKGQFWFSIQKEGIGNMGGELDGGDDIEDAEPYALPDVFNATFIGAGPESGWTNSKALHFRDNSGGKYMNSIFTEMGGKGLEIEDLASGEDSRARLEAGDLVLNNNLWWNFKGGNTLDNIAPDVSATANQQFVRDYLGNAANNNWIEDVMLRGISRTNDMGLDPRPQLNSPALSKEIANIPEDDEFLAQTDYIGAFGPNNLWIKGWTMMDMAGFVSDGGSTGQIIQVFDADINAGDVVNWTSNNTYILNGFVFVEEGAKLNIEAGTVVKGKPGQADQASALIIAKGGQIYAEGTPSDPIIFTFEADNPADHTDQPLDASGLWGGIIVLGKSITNNPNNIGQIEGIPSDEPRGAFGGGANPDPNDNSGIIRFVSIRHGGTNIGANNEINGLTMGAVGSGTQIDHVEVWYNNDDGFEWFGGTVNTKYLISAFNKDDSFDWDQGYNGKGQFWFSIQKEGIGNMGGELDGGDDIEDAEPYALPDVFNATFIGAGPESGWTNSKALHFRDNSGGKYMNSIFTEMGGKGLEIEDLASGEDSRARLEAGDLVLNNNLWWNFKGGNTLDNIAPDVSATANQQFVRDYLGNAANNNWVEDPGLAGISRTNDAGLKPWPANANSNAFTKNKAEIPNDGFFVQTDFIGAFGSENWLKDWTILYDAGFVGNLVSVENEKSNEDILISNTPNPFENKTTIKYIVSKSSNVKLYVYDLLGNRVARLVEQFMSEGEYSIDWDAKGLPAGNYFLRLETAENVITRQMVIAR